MSSLQKQILLDQLDDRIKRALAMVVQFYPELRDGTLDEIQANGLIDIAEGIRFFLHVIYDVNYNGNIQNYTEDILNIARNEFNE